jgi:peptidoglycan/LPS O-acetylase OafA/YrhL
MSNSRAWTVMPQLDGLRAFAVLAVLVSHFGLGPRLEGLARAADWGHLGVRLFFVLSGFLITRLLLERRRAIDAGVQSASSAIGRFYARRFLRIFPVFYACLLVTAILGVGHMREVVWRHAAYLSNFDGTLFAPAGAGRLLRDPTSAHFWSLAVEEQFYLFWPALILFLPHRRTVQVIAGMIAFASVWRALWFVLGARFHSAHLPACLDTLGIGALLACYADDYAGVRATFGRWLRLIGLAGAVILAAALAANAAGVLYRLRSVLLDLGEGIVFAAVVWRAAETRDDRLGRLLSARPLRYLGKISYGIYVFHAFMAPLQEWGFARLGLAPLPESFAR